MGLLVDGEWQTSWYDTGKTGGRFVRESSKFRNWVTPTGEPGPGGDGGFRAEAGRYHLYVSLACPWAHRTLIFRKLKRLEEAITVSVVDPRMADEGWVFGNFPGSTPDHLFGHRRLYEIYLEADPRYTGRATVPVLWDRERGTIVSNESADIIRMMNSAFDAVTDAREDYWPESLRDRIEEVNALVYERVNNGVYRAGFATTQEAYEEAATGLFETIDVLETRLAGQPYLVGAVPTEADWRLFTTLVRFDAVYHGHFKCNRRRIADYPNLSGLLHRLYHTPGVAETVDLEHIKTHYYWSHTGINPTRIVPIGPEIRF
jgi:glutathionyl-hydroquinone reductase